MEGVMRSREWKGWRNARARLCEWRTSGQKRSDLVLLLGARLLKDHSSRLSTECEISDNCHVIFSNH